METKFAKVSVNGNHFDENLKRKRNQSDARGAGASGNVLPLRSSVGSPVHKRRKMDESRSYVDGCTLSRYYSNFMKCGVPERLMFYQQGEWVDFPNDTLELVKKKFQAKVGMTETQINGEFVALDFLHMVKIDLKTGLKQSIAWIDEAGRCFFPVTFSHDTDVSDYQLLDPQGSGDITLQLLIQINGSDISSLKECSGDSDNFKCAPVHPTSAVRISHAMVEDNSVRVDGKKIDENHSAPVMQYLDVNAVRKLFYEGMHYPGSVDVISICRGESTLMDTRYELFLKQVEITQRYRGDANVRYAWLPYSKEMTSGIMKYGLCFSSPSKVQPAYGSGVHLFPANFSENSVNWCDIDENGVRQMILCHVIMGKMEFVFPGSKQFHPSGEEFDSGTDDLQNPKLYIVWDMNMHTHIFPEYVVSFKKLSDAIGIPAEGEKLNLPVAGDCGVVPRVQVQLDSAASDLTSVYHKAPTGTPREEVAESGSGSVRGPKSPWIPFSMLFAAIASRVPEKNMAAVYINYELFKCEKITRDEFVRKLRMLVGDSLLRAAVTSFPQTNPMKNEFEPAAPKLELKAPVNEE